ncbi:MAG: SH3 domain-containing protein, partial [Ruminococcus sp.]|nr:SH3 domain-containing protein [Ruminococcus sp.]
MWQWSWVGRFDGMSGDVDCNKMYVDLPNRNKSDTSYLSKCTYYPTNFNGTLTTTQNVRQYPSTDYSIIKSNLAAGTKVHVTGMYKNSYGNLWYQIEIDGVTGYVGGDTVSEDEFLYNDIAIYDPKMASNLDVGKGFYIEGNLASQYNNLTTVRASVYSGENTLTSPTLTSSYKENDKAYSLYKSEVDYGLNFGKLTKGYYTYEVSVDVTSYYCTDNSLSSRTQKVVVWKNPLTVGGAAITPPETIACVHDIVTIEGRVPTCTQEGLTMGTSCRKCGEVISKQQKIPALGHDYEGKKISSSCLDYEKMQYTCSNCGDTYVEYAQYEWQDTKPADYSDSKYEKKTQYRYSDLEVITSDKATVSGYTFISKSWQDKGNTTISYPKSWPSGFDKSHALYTQYNKTPKINSETGTNKYEIVSAEKANGWLYYHWCAGTYQYGPINRGTSATKTAEYPAFHAYYSTENPASKDKGNATDGSVIAPNASACKDSQWYYNVPIYTQTYKTYNALFTHGKWGSWSQWSDTPASASDTRQVETRELYRQIPQKGEHKFSRGKCNVCDYVCPHNWSDGKCLECKMSCIHKWVDGICTVCNQPCNHSWVNGVCTSCNKVCSHKWQDGVCTICGRGCAHNWVDSTCTSCGYVCQKHIYRDGVCSVCKTPCPGHNWQEGVCTVCQMTCTHNWQNGVCPDCNAVCEHNWRDGKCAICQTVCSHNFNNGKCTVCQTMCKHTWVNGQCTSCSMVCVHNWQNGICTTCNARCSHDWHNGICSICNKSCTHTWLSGTCKVCSLKCDHPGWANGYCTVCSKVCIHEYENSVCKLCNKVCKHIWYKGECLLCEYVCEHTWEEGKCKDCKESCKHKWNEFGICTVCYFECEHELDNGYCLICNCSCPGHEWSESVCIICNKVCEDHIYKDGECYICTRPEPEYYLVGFINGKDYGINEDYDNPGEYKFVDGKLVVTFTENSYVMLKAPEEDVCYMTNGYPPEGTTTVTLYDATYLYEHGLKEEKLFVPRGREITFTLVNNGNNTFTLSYTAAVCKHDNHSADGKCTVCFESVAHSFYLGVCTQCNAPCEHNWKNGKCIVCADTCSHTWEDSVCTTCRVLCSHKWTQDGCAHCKAICEHNFIDSGCTVCGINCSHKWSQGECSVCHMNCDHSFHQGVCSNCKLPCSHKFEDGICSLCNLVCQHKWNDGKCIVCAVACKHTYSNYECTTCKISQYYLVGYINNETVGFNENYANLGRYKFTGRSVTVAVKHDSYFFIKTSDNNNWYMAPDGSDE